MTLMKTSVMTATPVTRSSVMSLAVMRALARTGLTWRLRLLRMTDTERMMMMTGGGREAAAETGITSHPRRVSIEPRRNTRVNMETGTEVDHHTRVPRRRNLDTKIITQESQEEEIST